ncbi:MAG: citrate synthase [Acidimicrobiales bacterium]|jgi:citrate synthase
MGFGHAVYRSGDPRSVLMREMAELLAAEGVGVDLVGRAVEIERRILAELRRHRPDALIVTNVEYYAGVALHLAGVPAEAFTSCFTVSRVLGWSAHVLEQAANNKIMRPAARYIGPEPQRA